MRIITVFYLIILSIYNVISQNNQTSSPFSYVLKEDIKGSEGKRYLKARDYIKTDSLFLGKSIYFSPYLADLDFFYFKDAISRDSTLSKNLPSSKNRWFDDYYSSRLDSIMGKQCRNSDYIVFFSLVENSILRVDILPFKKDIISFQFKDVSLFPEDNTNAFLFTFEEKGDEIKSVYKIRITYD